MESVGGLQQDDRKASAIDVHMLAVQMKGIHKSIRHLALKQGVGQV